MDKLRIGVIGLGWFGEIHCETIAGIPNLELAALCTRRPERLAEQAKKFGVKKTYTDYRDMLADKDIDAVSIVTMWDQHTDPTTDALAAGKHVFLEKPMASTVADCKKIIAASKKAKGILQIGHICRFNPRYRMAKQAIDEGRIGKIVALSSRRNIPAAWTPTILEKIGPIVGDAIPRLRPDCQCTELEVPRHRPDHVPLQGRRHGNARDRVVHAGEDSLRH